MARSSLLQRLRRDNRGVALLEFALIAPVMIGLYLGCCEFCLAMMADKRAAHTAAAVGDLLAQGERYSTAELNDIFQISRAALTPYPADHLRIRFTQIKRNNETQYSVVPGSSCHKNWTQRNDVNGIPVGTVAVGQVMVLAEAEYRYQSPIGAFMPGITTFRAQYPYRPRQSEDIKGPNGAPMYTCPGTTW